MPIEELPIFCYFNRQRFTQYGSMDAANWYGIMAPDTKKKQALYPTMGRKHIRFLNQNKLVFNAEPRALFRTINYVYVVDGTAVYQVDKFFNKRLIGRVSLTGAIWFDFLPVNDVTYAMMTDEDKIYVITESGTSVTFATVTDVNAPTEPLYVAAFGNRFVVSQKNTPNYFLSTINLTGTVADYFTPAVFNRASGVIGQFAVLHSQLYILNDFTTDILANIPTQITVAGVTAEFPWKVNTSYNFDFGIADPHSLAVDFGRMVWLAQNSNGLVSYMVTEGGKPQDISSQAINVVLQQENEPDDLNPFLTRTFNSFLYQYENTIFYRSSFGDYLGVGNVDSITGAYSLEFNFETNNWHRCIELNGERNRIQKHVFFSNNHLVTVQDDDTIYKMAGNIYYNETRTPETTEQALDAYTKYPFRYTLITPQIFLPDYAEFIDDYVQIDFVFGDQTFYKSNAPFLNTVYIVDEASTPSAPVYLTTEDDDFIIAEGTNTPTFDDNHYNALFKPYIGLYYSDDGGVTFITANNLEFSQLGMYQWRMRWYELASSRNRCYKLVCVSSAPIVILGGVRNTRRISGGAN